MRKLAVRALIMLVLLGIGALFLVLYQAGVFKPSLHSKLKKVAHAAEPAWYLGNSFAGLKLTDVETARSRRVADFGYGRCRRFGSKWNPFLSSSCGYPLLVQTWRLDEGSDVTDEFIPGFFDGTCGRLTLRGVPAAVGSDGIVLYSGDEAIGLLGRTELLRGAIAALRPAGRAATENLPKPTTNAATSIARCAPDRHPFEPLVTRLRRLLRASGLPLVSTGDWFEDGQLTSAEAAGKAISLNYASCGATSRLGACQHVLSIDIEPMNRQRIASDLKGATCDRFAIGGAEGVVWRNTLPSGDIGGVYLFTGRAMVSTANDFVLQNLDSGKLRRVARSLRPLDETALPKPDFDAGGLFGLCQRVKASA